MREEHELCLVAEIDASMPNGPRRGKSQTLRKLNVVRKNLDTRLSRLRDDAPVFLVQTPPHFDDHVAHRDPNAGISIEYRGCPAKPFQRSVSQRNTEGRTLFSGTTELRNGGRKQFDHGHWSWQRLRGWPQRRLMPIRSLRPRFRSTFNWRVPVKWRNFCPAVGPSWISPSKTERRRNSVVEVVLAGPAKRA